MTSTVEQLTQIGIDRMIESAVKLAKGEDKEGREKLHNAVAAVINESDLSADLRSSAIRRLAEALKI